jgi:hypothetical protein
MPSQVMKRFADIHKAAVWMARQSRVTAWRIKLTMATFHRSTRARSPGELPGHIALYLILLVSIPTYCALCLPPVICKLRSVLDYVSNSIGSVNFTTGSLPSDFGRYRRYFQLAFVEAVRRSRPKAQKSPYGRSGVCAMESLRISKKTLTISGDSRMFFSVRPSEPAIVKASFPRLVTSTR